MWKMRMENKCEKCEFYKKHTLFTDRGVQALGATCLITKRNTKCVVDNRVITFDLQQQCPLTRLKEHEKLRKSWGELRNFMINLEKESDKLNFQCERLLKDVMLKIKELEKGE